MADLMQIKADSKTHPDKFARDRINKAVDRIVGVVEGTMTPEIRANVLKAVELFNSASSSR